LASANVISDPTLCQSGAQAGLSQIVTATGCDSNFTFVSAGVTTTGNTPDGTLSARCLCGTTTQYVDITTYSAGQAACTSLIVSGIPCIFSGYKEGP
jgi:hypothetical protein